MTVFLESPRKRVPAPRRAVARSILRQQGSTEEAAVEAQLALLRQARRDVIAALADSTGYRVFHLTQLLTAIDHEIGRARAGMQQAVSASTRRAFGLGYELVDRSLVSAGIQVGHVHLSSALLSAAVDVTTDQLRAVWGELGANLKAAIRRTTLGIVDPFEATKALARVIRDPKVFGKAITRAEVIVRTETNRVFSLATSERLRQSNERLGGGLKKYWLNAGDNRVRDTHVEAGERYAPGGNPGPIAVGQAYVVGGHRLMEPLDPRAPAKETVACRCRSIPWVEEIAARAA